MIALARTVDRFAEAPVQSPAAGPVHRDREDREHRVRQHAARVARHLKLDGTVRERRGGQVEATWNPPAEPDGQLRMF